MKTLASYMKAKPRAFSSRRGHPEQDLQDALLGALKLHRLFAFPLRNHGLLNKKTGAYNRVEKHHVAGVPDVAIVLPNGKILWVELKAADGRPSNEQIAFHIRLRGLGHDCIIAWTVHEVLAYLRQLGAIS